MCIFTFKSNSSLIDSFVFINLDDFFFLVLLQKCILRLFVYLFIYDFAGPLLLVSGFLRLWRVGAPLGCSVWASHRGGLSLPHAAPTLCCKGLVAPRHVGSSWVRDRPRIPFIGRRILIHCVTREALHFCLSFSPDLRKRTFIHSFFHTKCISYGLVHKCSIYTEVLYSYLNERCLFVFKYEWCWVLSRAFSAM